MEVHTIAREVAQVEASGGHFSRHGDAGPLVTLSGCAR